MSRSGLQTKRRLLALALTQFVLAAVTWAGPSLKLDIPRHRPCNLFFAPEESARLEGVVQCDEAGSGEARVTVVDYFGKTVLEQNLPLTLEAGKETRLPLDLASLPRGYFEVTLKIAVANEKGEEASASRKSCLGIVAKVNRTAAEVRENGYRFGMKWWSGVVDKGETLRMMSDLGLQWTRIIHNERGEYNSQRMLTEFPLNAVIKVERFPKSMYDEERYGPLAEWEAKYGRGAWTLKTLPKKEPYQAWLKEQIALIPAEQKVFEIWNEPWDKMSPEDFATICQWIVEVILPDRPDAIIGPNLHGSTSEFEYDAKTIAAGAMNGMKMVCLHPYGRSQNREWLRKYKQWINTKTGREIDVYITEYGSHSTPEGPAKRTEVEQARRVVHQSLPLYAEDMKALIPHWVGQSEKDPTYLEDWYGYIRRNQEPKPVLIAYANCARMIDGSRYAGDLWFGPEIGAMVFERDNQCTVALWTREGQKQIELETSAPEVTVVDMAGAESRVVVENGKLPLTISQDVIYVTGLGSEILKNASMELNPERWPEPAQPPRTTRTARPLPAKPTMDGKLNEWTNATQLAMVNPQVNGADASGTGYLSWDQDYLYLAVDMRDNEMFNTKPRAKLYQHDSIELFVSTAPRDEGSGYGPNDSQFFLTPTSGEGKPIVGKLLDREAGIVQDVAGADYWLGKTDKGWAAEVAIPWNALPDFKPEHGARLALEIRVNDADTSHERWKIDPEDGNPNPSNPSAWSILVLEQQ